MLDIWQDLFPVSNKEFTRAMYKHAYIAEIQTDYIPQNTSNCLAMKSYKMTFKKKSKISLMVVKNSQAITLTVCVHVHAHISSHSNWWNTSPHSVGMATTFGIVGYIWRLGYMLCCENISHITFNIYLEKSKRRQNKEKYSVLKKTHYYLFN